MNVAFCVQSAHHGTLRVAQFPIRERSPEGIRKARRHARRMIAANISRRVGSAGHLPGRGARRSVLDRQGSDGISQPIHKDLDGISLGISMGSDGISWDFEVFAINEYS